MIKWGDALFDPWPKANVIIGNPPYNGRQKMVADLGLEISELSDGDGDGKPDDTGQTLSMEQVGKLADVDVFFTASEDATGVITEEEALKANPLWTALPAVANEQVFPYDLEMVYGSPSGQDALLEIVRKALLG